MLRVHLSGEQHHRYAERLRAAAQATLRDQQIQDAELSLQLRDPAGMRALNRQYAGIDRPTDVLSFASGELQPEPALTYLGDVALCPAIARQAAESGRHSLHDELVLLTVHGVLHLLGFDHDTLQRKREMWSAQARILDRLGNPVRPAA